MKYCTKCGNQLIDEAYICPKCGCATELMKQNNQAETDAPNAGIAFISFLIPIVGLFIYLFFINQKPLMAKSASRGAWAGVTLSIFLSSVLYFILSYAF